MKDFLDTIYSYDYFSFYLILSIVVLILLFLVILFFGKKDKKNREIEATRKLEQINADTFKEVSVGEKLEVNNLESENLADTFTAPNVEEMPTLNYIEADKEIIEPILPTEDNNIDEIYNETSEPILEKIEEKPLVFEDTNILLNDVIIETEDKQTEEEMVLPIQESEKIEETTVPEFNFDSILKEVEEKKEQESQIDIEPIFSPNYVNTKEEIPVDKAIQDLEFELPSLKKEEIKESKVEEIDVPILNDYNLDELSGEIYNIKK